MESIDGSRPTYKMKTFPDDWFQALAAIPTILLSLTYQQNFFPIFKGMSKVNDNRFFTACCIGILISAICYAVFGILGYSMTGDYVEGNFLESIPYETTNRVIFILINGGFLVSNFATYPLMFFGCRNCFIAIIQVCTSPPKPKASLRSSGTTSNWRSPSNLKSQMTSEYIDDEARRERKKK